MISRKEYDLIIIGGGPGGMAAAVRANELGVKNILLIERDCILGGILPQCIHSGFGLEIFKKQLTGPEYAQLFIDKIKCTNIEVMLNTMVLSIDKQKNIIVSNKSKGIKNISAKSIILALGCRERTRGAINIPGTRPSGVFTAGLVQRMVNVEGYLPGRDILILGSGDIGLIMARRLKLEDCNIKGVYELMPFSSGLKRNIVQCLEDYDIPLFLSHTISKIYGERRIEAVEVSKVDNNFNLIPQSGKKILCDTLLLSVGLIPENEVTKTAGIELDKNSGGPMVDENLESTVEGIFTCGNSLFVNDLVDNVTEDGYIAAQSASIFLKGRRKNNQGIKVIPGDNVAYIVPQKVSGKADVVFRIRAKNPMQNAYVKFSKVGFKKKVRFVVPAELIFIKVKSKNFKSMELLGNNIKVNINSN